MTHFTFQRVARLTLYATLAHCASACGADTDRSPPIGSPDPIPPVLSEGGAFTGGGSGGQTSANQNGGGTAVGAGAFNTGAGGGRFGSAGTASDPFGTGGFGSGTDPFGIGGGFNSASGGSF
jgi:hypothetical protein